MKILLVLCDKVLGFLACHPGLGLRWKWPREQIVKQIKIGHEPPIFLGFRHIFDVGNSQKSKDTVARWKVGRAMRKELSAG
jgi:hypothetical protein